MAKDALSKEQRDIAVRKLARYLKDEMDHEAGGFEVGFLLDFIARELGPYFYNEGVRDAQAHLAERMETLVEALYALEKPFKD